MEGRDAVHGVRADDGEVCHAALAIPEDCSLLELVHPVLRIMREGLAVAAVDLVDEHVGARKLGAEHRNRPLLEGFRHDRVVRVGDSRRHGLPGRIPVKALLIDEDAHELGAAECRVRIVRVDADMLREVFPGIGAEVALIGVKDRLQACRDEEVLLLEAQKTSMLARIVRVEDRGDGLDIGAELERLGIVAGIEGIEIEVRRMRLCAPDAELVHAGAAEADDRHIVRDGVYLLAAFPGEPVAASLALVAHDLAAEAHRDGALELADLPREAIAEPVVRLLDLASALDLLAEEAIAVAHAIAVAGDAESCHGVEEAGRKTAEAAVAEARVGFLGAEGLKV